MSHKWVMGSQDSGVMEYWASGAMGHQNLRE